MWLFIIYNWYRIWYLVEVAEYEGLVLSHYCLQILVVVEVYSIILIIFLPHGQSSCECILAWHMVVQILYLG